MTITYNLDIPAGPNNPSADRPLMTINTNAVSTIMAVDHYTFADTSAGQHKQVTFPSKVAQGAQATDEGTIYTADGVQSTKAELIFKNANADFNISCIKAVGSFAMVAAAGAVTPIMSIGVSTIAASSSTVYVITLLPNVTTGTKAAIFMNLSKSPTGFYTYINTSLSANVLTITFDSAAVSVGAIASFAIIQN